jgi:hypothetical protein
VKDGARANVFVICGVKILRAHARKMKYDMAGEEIYFEYFRNRKPNILNP